MINSFRHHYCINPAFSCVLELLYFQKVNFDIALRFTLTMTKHAFKGNVMENCYSIHSEMRHWNIIAVRCYQWILIKDGDIMNTAAQFLIQKMENKNGSEKKIVTKNYFLTFLYFLRYLVLILVLKNRID